MKVYSTWKKSTYLFDLFIGSVMEDANETNSKMALVNTAVYTKDKMLLWKGQLRVKLNSFGIYPVPEDLRAIGLPESVVKMLIIELRRYIKPQKDFL